MTIAEGREKCKSFIAKVPRDMLIIGVLVLASSASFTLGYLAGLEGGQGVPVPILTGALTQPIKELPASATATSAAGHVVASKNGTKYYFPSCAGANRISPANKISFASVELAEAAGYSPAANCK